MSQILMGEPAISRSSYHYNNNTVLLTGAPANGTGTILTINVYLYYASANDFYVGIFFQVSGYIYQCRSAADIGVLTAGLNTKSVSLAVVAGDNLGWYCPSEMVEDDTYAGGPETELTTMTAGNRCVPGLQTNFNANIFTGGWVSYQGVGQTPAVSLYLGGLPAAKRMRPLRGW